MLVQFFITHLSFFQYLLETVSPPELTLWSYIKTKVYMVTEGVTLILNCSVQQGTVPITFTWYRKGVVNPLNSTQISKTQGFHIIKSITHADEGIYYCQASNDANETKKSHSITIEGHTSPTLHYTINVFLRDKTS